MDSEIRHLKIIGFVALLFSCNNEMVPETAPETNTSEQTNPVIPNDYIVEKTIHDEIKALNKLFNKKEFLVIDILVKSEFKESTGEFKLKEPLFHLNFKLNPESKTKDLLKLARNTYFKFLCKHYTNELSLQQHLTTVLEPRPIPSNLKEKAIAIIKSVNTDLSHKKDDITFDVTVNLNPESKRNSGTFKTEGSKVVFSFEVKAETKIDDAIFNQLVQRVYQEYLVTIQ